jgi:hypothetical protein
MTTSPALERKPTTAPLRGTEDEIEGEDSIGTGPEPVTGKNADATSTPREASGTGGKVMALCASALLLAAGVYVAAGPSRASSRVYLGSPLREVFGL